MKKIVISVIGVIVVVIIIAGVWLYTGNFNATKAKAFKQLSLPVALVNSRLVSGREFMHRFELAELLYKDDPTYKSEDSQKQILQQLIDNAKLSTVAKAHDIKATNEDINNQYQAIVQQFAQGDEARLEELLKEDYHLGPEDFKDKVIKPDVMLTNLTIWYHNQKDLNQAAYAKEKELLDKLDSGTSFEEVVKAYTQDEATKDFGGDMDFVKLSELAPEFRNAVKDAKNGDRLTVVSRYGLHILQVIEIDRSQGEPSYHLQQIFIEGNKFEEWYMQQADAVKAIKLIKV